LEVDESKESESEYGYAHNRITSNANLLRIPAEGIDFEREMDDILNNYGQGKGGLQHMKTSMENVMVSIQEPEAEDIKSVSKDRASNNNLLASRHQTDVDGLEQEVNEILEMTNFQTHRALMQDKETTRT